MSGWTGVIITALTVVIGPLLTWALKRWWDKVLEKAERAKREKDEAEAAKKNDEKVGEQTGEINDSIDAQRKAREQWLKDHPEV